MYITECHICDRPVRIPSKSWMDQAKDAKIIKSFLLHSEAVTESLLECLDSACTIHSPLSFLPSLPSFLFSKTSN